VIRVTEAASLRDGGFLGAPGMARSAQAQAMQLWWLLRGLEGESPLQALMVGTASRTARVSIARWNLKEAVSKPAARRTGSE
jgi:hypothetical protein